MPKHNHNTSRHNPSVCPTCTHRNDRTPTACDPCSCHLQDNYTAETWRDRLAAEEQRLGVGMPILLYPFIEAEFQRIRRENAETPGIINSNTKRRTK